MRHPMVLSVPHFDPGYFPSKTAMTTEEQRDFFVELTNRLDMGEYLDVEGNISYVFIYLYRVLEQRESSGFSALTDHLIRIGELYADQAKISDYCHFWAYDCLLAEEKYDEYLEKTEPASALGTSTHAANLRLNVQRWVGRDAGPIDVLLTSGRNRPSSFVRKHEALYRESALEEMAKYAADRGGWFGVFDAWGCSKEEYGHYLFSGSPTLAPYHRKIACFYAAKELEVVSGLVRQAEDRVRTRLGLPRLGEGWVSETALFQRVKAKFAETTVIQHGRPDWLGNQHLDVWMPHWRIALEYQGRQHFEPVAFFGGADAFERTVERDRRKAELAKLNGVALLLVTEDDDLDDVFERIWMIRSRELDATYRQA